MPYDNIKGYTQLTDKQQQFFQRMHFAHLKTMGVDSQKKYALANIVKVAWDRSEKSVNVYYKDTWWHYCNRGWY